MSTGLPAIIWAAGNDSNLFESGTFGGGNGTITLVATYSSPQFAQSQPSKGQFGRQYSVGQPRHHFRTHNVPSLLRAGPLHVINAVCAQGDPPNVSTMK